MSQCVNSILSGIKGINSCSTNIEPLKVTNIAESNGKVIVTFNNGTFTEAEMSIVDKTFVDSLQEVLSAKLKELTEFKENFKQNLEPVMDLGGNISHYVLKTNFLEGN